jgi:hypothetical protein
LLLGGDLRRRVDVRLRVVPDFAVLDLRAVGDFLVLEAFVADRVPDFAVDDFARVDRRVPLVADADFRVDAALVPVADFRRVVVFVRDAALVRDFDAADDLRLDVEDLRFDPEPRSVKRLVSPARTVVAFSSCATPRATSSCASATALSTGPRLLDRFDRVFFLAAIAFSHQIDFGPVGAVWTALQGM